MEGAEIKNIHHGTENALAFKLTFHLQHGEVCAAHMQIINVAGVNAAAKTRALPVQHPR